MARYKDVNYAQQKFIPVDFSSQVLPGTFEYTLNHLIENEIDLSIFDERYCNMKQARRRSTRKCCLKSSSLPIPGVSHLLERLRKLAAKMSSS